MGEQTVFTKNQLNYFRVCHLATNTLPKVLRNIFIAEWNRSYSTQYGRWENSCQNGQDYVNLESKKNKKRNGDILNVMASGDCNTWDCTKLFYALLYSDSLGKNLDQNDRRHLDGLRKLRNESFAHVSLGEVSSSDFQKIINQILQAFLGLGQDTMLVKQVQNQNFFSVEQVRELVVKLEKEKSSQEEFDERLSDLEERVAFLETRSGSENSSRELSAAVYHRNDRSKLSRTPLLVPPFCLLPPAPNHRVISREVLTLAFNTLSHLKTIHDSKITAVYIAGAPGAGATECARQIGKAVTKAIPYIMTFDASIFENFVTSLKQVAMNFGFSDKSAVYFQETSLTSQCEVLSLFMKEKLGSVSAWLAILDGVTEETQFLQSYLPQTAREGTGQFLITTHDKAIILDTPYTSAIYLDGLTLNESSELLRVIAGPLTQETARTVSETLGYQPEFLTSAASYIKKLSTDNNIGPVDDLWKEHLDFVASRYKDHVAYYFAAINQSTRSKLDSVIETLFKRCQIYEEFFHLLVLAKGAPLPFNFAVRFLSYHLMTTEDEVQQLLRDCLLLTVSEKGSFEFIEVNKVVYKLVSDVIAPHVIKEQMLVRLKSLGHFALKNTHDSMICGVFKLFTPEILRYLSLLDLNFPDYPEQRNLHHELGKAFQCVLVDYTSAVRCFTKAMLIFENANDIGHREYARILSSLGNVFRLTGNTDEACRYLNRSLKLLKSISSSLLDEDIANCLSCLGLVHQSLRDLDRARKLHAQALTIRQEIYGEEDINTATSLNNIGGVHHESGNLATAKDYYWRALEIKGRNYGWDFPHVANSFNNIAEISHEQGDLCGALSIHKRSLKIRQRLYGEIHPDVANSLNNIAVIYHKLGELTPARKYHSKVVEIRQMIYGEDHAEVASSLSNLGQVYYDEGDLAAAEQCHAQALSIRQRHSTASPHVINSLHNLMRVYLADHEITTAKAYAYQLFKIFQQNYGIKDARTVHAFRRITKISKRESQGQAFEVPCDTFEEVEKLSCL